MEYFYNRIFKLANKFKFKYSLGSSDDEPTLVKIKNFSIKEIYRENLLSYLNYKISILPDLSIYYTFEPFDEPPVPETLPVKYAQNLFNHWDDLQWQEKWSDLAKSSIGRSPQGQVLVEKTDPKTDDYVRLHGLIQENGLLIPLKWKYKFSEIDEDLKKYNLDKIQISFTDLDLEPRIRDLLNNSKSFLLTSSSFQKLLELKKMN
jgi:hypothetical protein